MGLKYRFLTLDDLPAIRKLSNSMDIRNDPKIGETAERRIKDPSCDLYGAFSEEGKLVARAHEKLGFTRSHEMTAFYLPKKEKTIQPEDNSKLEPIPAKEALSLMRKIPNVPTEEICVGWDYRPLVTEIFENNPDMNFFIHEDTLALEVRERASKAGEVKWVKAIIYGNEENAVLLLNGIRSRNMNVDWFSCLVPKALEPTIEQTGFKYASVWTGKKNIVVLLKKYL